MCSPRLSGRFPLQSLPDLENRDSAIRLATVNETGKIVPMSSGRFDSMERHAADNVDRILAEVEKDREELAKYSGQTRKVGAQQGLLNATELLNALQQLSRLLKGR